MKFIAQSESTKKILNIAKMSVNLPVNILIIGPSGVGKKLLANEILDNSPIFDGKILEESLINKTIHPETYKELIITNIDHVLNKKEFFSKLQNIKIIATSSFLLTEIEPEFAIKIDVPPLNERAEDLEELIQFYIKEAEETYDITIDTNDLCIDLSSNGISLKKSIFKNGFLKHMNDDDLQIGMKCFIQKKLKQDFSYKDLLQYFERPLLQAAKKEYKSQLKMATKLHINRITLRKKIDLYLGES